MLVVMAHLDLFMVRVVVVLVALVLVLHPQQAVMAV
jgi:hypothetical protein